MRNKARYESGFPLIWACFLFWMINYTTPKGYARRNEIPMK